MEEESCTWSNRNTVSENTPTMEELVALFEKYPPPDPETTIARLEVPDLATQDWVTAQYIKADPLLALSPISLMCLPIYLDESLPPNTILGRNRDGKPLKFFIKK